MKQKKDPQQATAAAKKAATFKKIYESRDGKICLFEDEKGHITAVNSKRLA